jgi:hypothetical protein
MDPQAETVVNSAFPQKRLDEMAAFARDFDRKNWQQYRTDCAWDFTSHFDAGSEAVFIARQLEMIRKGLYEIRYPELKARRLVPHDFNFSPGMQEYTARSIDVAGEPAVSKDQPDDVPTVELKVGSATMSMFNLVLAYSYSDQDAENAMFAGMPLATMKAKAVRDQMARRLDNIAFVGESTMSGVTGLLNSSGTTTYSTPATGAGASKLWDNKDSDQILLDLNGAGDQIITDTKEVEEPDTWLLPLTAHRLIANKRVGDGTSATILRYFLDNRDTPVTVEKTAKSETLGGSSTRRMCVYKNDPSKLQMIVPVEFRQKQPEIRGFKVVVNCMMRTGGVALWLPKSVCYADGI